jgi:uncharacterized lipoprotein YddW (UPF0748 family)
MRCFQIVVILLVAIASVSSLGGSRPDPRLEIRAAWVTRWAFKTPEDVKGIFADLEHLGINTVFFQVRGACDALYLSAHEPWSSVLTGRLGENPGWDPLTVALEEGRRLGVGVHAWMNLFPAWPVSESGDPPPVSLPPHVFHAHPEWLARDTTGSVMSLVKAENRHNYAFLSPTHPGVQHHLQSVLEDVAERYDIDGIHLDYVRFPDSSYSYDLATILAYRLESEAGDSSFADWRRENLTGFVGQLAEAVKKVNPGLKVSAAIWQKIDDGKTHYFQDGVGWVKRGYVDFVVPMIYTTDQQAFERRLDAYCELAGEGNVVAGMGPYLDGFTDSLLTEQLSMAGRHGVRGFSIFNSEYALKYGSAIRAYSAED